MAWWPWRRPGDEPARAAGPPREVAPAAEPAARSGDWAELPPVQRVLERPVAPVAPLEAFRASLATSHDPSFLAPLSHAVDPSTGGLVDGIAAPLAPRVHPAGPKLAVPPRPSAPAPRVQRAVARWSSPGDAGPAAGAAAPPVPAAPPAGAAPAGEHLVGSAEPDASPEAVASVEAMQVESTQVESMHLPEPTQPPLPSRSLAAVAESVPTRSEQPRLPVPELPVVSRLSAGTRPPVHPPSPARVAFPTPEPSTASAPLSGFAAAIAAIGDHEEPSGLPSPVVTPLATPLAPAVTGPVASLATTVPSGSTVPGASEPVAGASDSADAVAAPADRPLLGGPAPDLDLPHSEPLQPDPVHLDPLHVDPTHLDSGGPTTVAAPTSTFASVQPTTADPELPVVSRSVDLAAARPRSVPAPAGSRSVPTLGTGSSTPAATAPAVASTAPGSTAAASTAAASTAPTWTARASTAAAPTATAPPALQRRVETAAVQPLEFLPVGTATTAPVRPAASPIQRVVAASAVKPTPGRPWSPAASAASPAASPALLSGPTALSGSAVLSGLIAAEPVTDIRPSAAPPVVLRSPVVGSSASFAQMFPAGSAAADAGRQGYLSVPLQRRVDVDELQVEPQPDPVEPAPTDRSGDSAGPAGADPAPTSATSAAVGAAPGPAAGGSAADLEELARRLYEPLSARIRAELWLDRERSGV